jgi:hypothetical protein
MNTPGRALTYQQELPVGGIADRQQDVVRKIACREGPTATPQRPDSKLPCGKRRVAGFRRQ